MKNKFLALFLALAFLLPFNSRVSAVKPEDLVTSTSRSSLTPPIIIIGGVALIVAGGYIGYKIDRHFFEKKEIIFDGNSTYGDSLGSRVNPRDDLNAQRYARNLLKSEIPKLRKSNIFEARHLANICRFIMSTRLDLERYVDVPEARQIASYLKNKDEYLTRLMDRERKTTVGELISELREIDALVSRAIPLIDEHIYKKQ